jgi:hypothetical protein
MEETDFEDSDHWLAAGVGFCWKKPAESVMISLEYSYPLSEQIRIDTELWGEFGVPLKGLLVRIGIKI